MPKAHELPKFKVIIRIYVALENFRLVASHAEIEDIQALSATEMQMEWDKWGIEIEGEKLEDKMNKYMALTTGHMPMLKDKRMQHEILAHLKTFQEATIAWKTQEDDPNQMNIATGQP